MSQRVSETVRSFFRVGGQESGSALSKAWSNSAAWGVLRQGEVQWEQGSGPQQEGPLEGAQGG